MDWKNINWNAAEVVIGIISFMLLFFFGGWPNLKAHLVTARSAIVRTVIFGLHAVTFILWPKLMSGFGKQSLYVWLVILTIGGGYCVLTALSARGFWGRIFRGSSGLMMIVTDIVLWGLMSVPMADYSWEIGRQMVRAGIWGSH